MNLETQRERVLEGLKRLQNGINLYTSKR